MKIIKPGDRIILYLENRKFSIFTPISFEYDSGSELPYRVRQSGSWSTLCLDKDAFDVLQPPEYIPKVGDIIILTHEHERMDLRHKKIKIETVIEDGNWTKISSQDLPLPMKQVWLPHNTYETIKQFEAMPQKSCKDCKGTGKITLFTSVVDCDCKHQTPPDFPVQGPCWNCDYEYCECDGKCDLNKGGCCSKCGVCCCEACLVDGTCRNCFSKSICMIYTNILNRAARYNALFQKLINCYNIE